MVSGVKCRHSRIARSGAAIYDVIGVQTNRDLQALQGYLASQQIVLKAQALFPERTLDAVHIDAFPISIPTTETMRLSARAVTHAETKRLKESLDGRKLMIGVDRLDYSKALPARLKAIDAMLEQSPNLIRTFTYLQISPPSRAGVYGYDELRQEVEALVGHINGKYATFDWTPIRFLAQGLRRETLMGFYRSADVCLVTPYRDGMNLVAKEYIAAQDAQSPGVLVLSEFTGAAEELKEAVLVNPYDIPAMAGSFHAALTMPDAERKTRWRRMMLQLKQHDLKAWQDKFLDALSGGLS
jgi:trehalose 6-phosphate synthase